MDQSSSDCVTLEAACKVLARSTAVRDWLKNHFGEERYPVVLERMRMGLLEGELGVELHDLLTDEIRNEAETVWSGVIRQPHDEYPVTVNGFHGVYWAWAMEYDPVGYFLNKRVAIAFARSHWGYAS